MSIKLIKNAKLFDGKSKKLREHASVIIENHFIKEIIQNDISEEQFDEVIDAQQKTVIPGLVDNHVHIAMPYANMRLDETIVHGINNAKRMLLNGFTTVRDAGGIVAGIKRGIDEGYIDGPRIYPSNAFISQTCGHGDFRESRAHVRLSDGAYTSPVLRSGGTVIADGVSEVLRATREQLFLGASQIKIMAGGGMSSAYDPIETVQYTSEEMKAAVSAAADYGTYVMAHLYTRESMMRAARAGVKSFEHAHLIDEELARVIKDSGIFLCPCPQFRNGPGKKETAGKRRKSGAELVYEGVLTQTELILKHSLPFLFGTDYMEIFAANREDAQISDFAVYEERFGSYLGLLSATGNANELIRLTTYQNPYPDGKIGVLEEGSYADLLIVDGNPLEHLSILSDRDKICLIMKDAKIYKNTLRKGEKR